VRSKLDTNSTSPVLTNKKPVSSSNRPGRVAVVGEIAQQATGAA